MLMEMRDVCKRYTGRGRYVVEHVNLTIDEGETLAVCGDSGSGKSTIGQMMAGLFPASGGEILFQGKKLAYPFRGEARRRIQILFQHPEVAFNPRMKLLDSLREPYRFYKLPFSEAALCAYLADYGIYAEHLDRYPAELSGGELQRMALARLMLAKPRLIVLDEPTSMLDVISQAQVIHLLEDLQKREGLGYLFISHDRLLCEAFATRRMFLHDGALTDGP